MLGISVFIILTNESSIWSGEVETAMKHLQIWSVYWVCSAVLGIISAWNAIIHPAWIIWISEGKLDAALHVMQPLTPS